MASSKDYLEYVLELLKEVEGITYKKMMGEYMLYKEGIIFGGVYDNRFLIKKTKSLENSGLKEQIPYPSAKSMFLIDSEDPDEIKRLVLLAINDLK
jgi:TfoX/Sxy family transcriptional regulator of competence genes